MNQLEAHIDARIRRIQGRRKGDPDELRQHILDAVEDGDMAEVDQAFDALGGDAAIRETFFPPVQRHPIDRITLIGLGLALLTILAVGAFDVQEATCTVEGQGTCNAQAGGAVADVLLLAAAPVAAWVALRWLDPRFALAPAGLLLFFAFMRASSSLTPPDGVTIDPVPDLIVLAAAGACLGIVIRHVLASRAP